MGRLIHQSDNSVKIVTIFRIERQMSQKRKISENVGKIKKKDSIIFDLTAQPELKHSINQSTPFFFANMARLIHEK
jgi:hypothetical protein